MRHIQYHLIRDEINPVFTEFMGELDNAYYNHWRQGIPFKFLGEFDPILTSLDAKTYFDTLHGICHLLYDLILDLKNDALSEPYVTSYFDEELNEQITVNDIKEKADQSRLELQNYVVAARQIKPELETRLNILIY